MTSMHEWTIMIYANGNNELAPEMWSSIKQVETLNIHQNIRITVQIALEKKKIIKLIRPDLRIVDDEPDWNDVKRYSTGFQGHTPQENLGNLNMADPKNLRDFIVWSQINFPAKKYMLILSGHIYQFVGMLPDYSQETPYFMCFPELSLAIDTACRETGSQIDLLVLDTCYAGTLENLFEFGKIKNPFVKYVLTYFGNGSLNGLPYEKMIDCLMQNPLASTDAVLYNFIFHFDAYEKNYHLVLYKIDSETLTLIQKLFSFVAYQYILLHKKLGVELSPYELLQNLDTSLPWSVFIKTIHLSAKSLIVLKSERLSKLESAIPIHVLYKKIPDEKRRSLYNRLSFAKKNYWSHMLCDIPLDKTVSPPTVDLFPTPMTAPILQTFVSSSISYLSNEKQKEIFQQLICEKNWKMEN